MNSKMNTQNLEQWTGKLLTFLALGSFILSYAGMYAVAVDSGYGLLAYLWPLVTEAAVVIFSLVYLVAKLHGYKNRSLMPLIIGCTALSVVFNVWHAPTSDLLARAVVALPPLFLFAAFKTWIWKIEQDSKLAGLVTAIADLVARRDQTTLELNEFEIEAAARRESVSAELEILGEMRDRLNGELAGLRQQVSELRRQLKDLEEQVTGARVDDRSYQQAKDLRDQGHLTWKQVAGELGVSESTAKRWYHLAEPEQVNGRLS